MFEKTPIWSIDARVPEAHGGLIRQLPVDCRATESGRWKDNTSSVCTVSASFEVTNVNPRGALPNMSTRNSSYTASLIPILSISISCMAYVSLLSFVRMSVCLLDCLSLWTIVLVCMCVDFCVYIYIFSCIDLCRCVCVCVLSNPMPLLVWMCVRLVSVCLSVRDGPRVTECMFM